MIYGVHRPGQDRRAEHRRAAGNVLAVVQGGSASHTIAAPSSPATPGFATNWVWPRILPTRIPSRRRGGDENRNDIIRRYLSKCRKIDMGMAKDVQKITDETDNRPMRVLGYRTLAEAFIDELTDLQNQQRCCASYTTSPAQDAGSCGMVGGDGINEGPNKTSFHPHRTIFIE